MSENVGHHGRSVRAYAIEIGVIVFSILLAFGLDRGYDNLSDRHEERITLQGLRVDFLR